MKKIFALFLLFVMVAACNEKEKNSITLETRQVVSSQNEYDNILAKINEYEIKNNVSTEIDPNTKGFWDRLGWAALCDAIPFGLGCFVHPALGLVLGSYSSIIMWAFTPESSTVTNPDVLSAYIEEASLSPYVVEEYGSLHNEILRRVLIDIQATPKEAVTDEWLYECTKKHSEELLKDLPIELTFDEVSSYSIFPDCRKYTSIDEYKKACYELRPDSKQALDVIFKTHETLSAQKTKEDSDKYVVAVEEIVNSSSLTPQEKEQINGSLHIASGSKSFWYDKL